MECKIDDKGLQKNTYFTCKSCLSKLCANMLPPLSTLNGMGVTETNPEILIRRTTGKSCG